MALESFAYLAAGRGVDGGCQAPMIRLVTLESDGIAGLDATGEYVVDSQ
jgi:hypothetical protein